MSASTPAGPPPSGVPPIPGPAIGPRNVVESVLDALGLSVDDAALIVAVVALLVAVVPGLRRGFGRVLRRVVHPLRRGEHRYARWFLTTHGRLRNFYLPDRDEEIGLASTFVPLDFRARNRDSRVAAARVLSDHDRRRLLIVGDPGTGKSTLLRAYGSAVLRRVRGRDAVELGSKELVQGSEVPFFVPLRELGRYLDQGDGRTVASFLVAVVLKRDAKLARPDEMLRRLLRDGRCLVLFDGLDEVSTSRYELVRDAVLDFAFDESDELPTARARIVLTCRRQNFLKRTGDWVPRFVEAPHVLAPLRDVDIATYVRKREAEMRAGTTFDTYWASLQQSGTIDLHRVPLILAISVALYVNLPAYSIPRSITTFYDGTLNELLPWSMVLFWALALQVSQKGAKNLSSPSQSVRRCLRRPGQPALDHAGRLTVSRAGPHR